MADQPAAPNAEGGFDRPACDRCKGRKTKCDRNKPCSACVTASVPCKYTKQHPEKRQRVLLSAKYDDSLQGVNQQLAGISKALQDIAAHRESTAPTPETQSILRSTEALSSGLRLDDQHERWTFRGESSFHAHARDVEQRFVLDTPSSSLNTSWGIHTQDSTTENINGSNMQTSLMAGYPELAKRELPPVDISKQLLSLAQRAPQRIFFEVPVIDTTEINDICQMVYLLPQRASISDWITLNVVLLYLFTNLDEKYYPEVAVTDTQVQDIEATLESNCVAAIKSLRLCTAPSHESCRATALLANYALRAGNHSTAFRLITFAARTCLDLGYHRRPSDLTGKKIGMFWHVYALDRYLAFTRGRTPTIPHYDVTSEYRSLNEQSPLVSSGLGLAFIELAYLVGQIQLQLFSATAQETSHEIRTNGAEHLAAQLSDLAASLQISLTPNDESSQGVFGCLSVMVYCYLTVVYMAVPSDPMDDQLDEKVISAARKAMENLLYFGQNAYSHSLESWSRLLNTLLAFAPFVPILVLARSTITNPSQNHLDTLDSIMALVGVVAPISPAANELLVESGKLYLAAKAAATSQK